MYRQNEMKLIYVNESFISILLTIPYNFTISFLQNPGPSLPPTARHGGEQPSSATLSRALLCPDRGHFHDPAVGECLAVLRPESTGHQWGGVRGWGSLRWKGEDLLPSCTERVLGVWGRGHLRWRGEDLPLTCNQGFYRRTHYLYRGRLIMERSSLNVI